MPDPEAYAVVSDEPGVVVVSVTTPVITVILSDGDEEQNDD